MFVKTFPVGAFQCNCTILGDEQTGEAMVIDPGDEGPRIISELQKKSFKVKYIIHTHAHLDHIGATRHLKEQTGGTIGLHKDDLFLYENIAMQGELLGMRVDPKVSPVDHYLQHGDCLDWGDDLTTEVLHTPGHTPGSLTFLMKNAMANKNLLFAGDTLFMGSIGRTDLWGGDYDLILESIKTKLLPLSEDTVVICGHGPNTTIGQEKKSNPFLK
ncbi:MAG TPA: MBL fold metallo-hydrolase [Deltaproteobacteria bacterium]|nr:MBL fold metallo-hydrolase [Deltaproteobacteria bacterium]